MMKKLISLLLTLLMVITLAACGGEQVAGASDQNKPDAAKQEMGDLLSKVYADSMKSGQFLLHYQGTVTAEGQTMEMDVTTAVDGETIATISVMNGMTVHTLLQDGVMYLIDDQNKTYSEMEMMAGLELGDTAELEYKGKGTATVDGKEMHYEEYAIENGLMRYYFDGDKLYAISETVGSEEMMMKVLEFSDKVPEDMVSIPAGYTKGASPFGGMTMDEATQKELEDALAEAGMDYSDLEQYYSAAE